jgi:biotin synthase
MFKDIIGKIDHEEELTKKDLTCLLSLEDEEELDHIYKKADDFRKKYIGDEVHLRGLIEFS